MRGLSERWQPGGDKYESLMADLAWERAHERQAEAVEDEEDDET